MKKHRYVQVGTGEELAFTKHWHRNIRIPVNWLLSVI